MDDIDPANQLVGGAGNASLETWGEEGAEFGEGVGVG